MAALAAAREAPLSHDNNPYAKALEGLHLDDPVKAFFDFCREREAIRIRREKGWRTHHFKLLLHYSRRLEPALSEQPRVLSFWSLSKLRRY